MFEALKTFSGTITAKKGDRVDIKDPALIKDLLDAKYIKEVKKTVKKKKEEGDNDNSNRA